MASSTSISIGKEHEKSMFYTSMHTLYYLEIFFTKKGILVASLLPKAVVS